MAVGFVDTRGHCRSVDIILIGNNEDTTMRSNIGKTTEVGFSGASTGVDLPTSHLVPTETMAARFVVTRDTYHSPDLPYSKGMGSHAAAIRFLKVV